MELLKTGSLLGDHDLRDELQTSSTYSRNTENPAGLAPHLVPGSAFVFCAWLEMQQTWVLVAVHHSKGYMQISYTANLWTSFTERAYLVQEHESYAASCLTDAANTPWKSHRRQNLRTHVHILIIAVQHPPTVLGAPVTAATHQSVELL